LSENCLLGHDGKIIKVSNAFTVGILHTFEQLPRVDRQPDAV